MPLIFKVNLIIDTDIFQQSGLLYTAMLWESNFRESLLAFVNDIIAAFGPLLEQIPQKAFG